MKFSLILLAAAVSGLRLSSENAIELENTIEAENALELEAELELELENAEENQRHHHHHHKRRHHFFKKLGEDVKKGAVYLEQHPQLDE